MSLFAYEEDCLVVFFGGAVGVAGFCSSLLFFFSSFVSAATPAAVACAESTAGGERGGGLSELMSEWVSVYSPTLCVRV